MFVFNFEISREMSSVDYRPIYKKLTEFYRDRILSQEIAPGTKIDSINRMMDRHKVSRETAKLVIRNLVNEGLVISVHGKGTFVNVLSETKKKWGVVIPFLSSNIAQLIIELGREADNANCDLEYYLHYNNFEEEIRITGSLVQQGYEAVIVVPNYNEALTAEYYKRLITGRTILLLADNTMAGSFFNYVIQSYDLGVKRAVDYLASKTNMNILLLGEEIWKGKNLVFDLMENTMRIMIADLHPGRELYVTSSINQVNALYLEDRRIGGILTIQDSDAVRLMGRLKEWGIKVPEKVAIVSYGNTEVTKYFNPGITAIDCNYPKMASEISAHISGSRTGQKRQVVISPEIVVRET